MKRSKRIWPVALIGISILTAFLIFNSYRTWQTDRRSGEERLEFAIREMDRHVPGWLNHYENRNRQLAPEADNSAYLLRDAWKRTPFPCLRAPALQPSR